MKEELEQRQRENLALRQSLEAMRGCRFLLLLSLQFMSIAFVTLFLFINAMFINDKVMSDMSRNRVRSYVIVLVVTERTRTWRERRLWRARTRRGRRLARRCA